MNEDAADESHPPRDLYSDSVLVVWGGRSTAVLPRSRAPANMATDRRLLNVPPKSLADFLAPNKIVIDCGGMGPCGPNSLAFLLGMLSLFDGDGVQLRREIVKYVNESDVLGHATQFCWQSQPRSTLSCRDLMLENMKLWPENVIHGRMLNPSTYCEITSNAEAWTDLTFLQLCASRFRVAVNLIGVDDLSAVVSYNSDTGRCRPRGHGGHGLLDEPSLCRGDRRRIVRG